MKKYEDTFDVLLDHDIGGVRPAYHYRHYLPAGQVSAIYLLGSYESLHQQAQRPLGLAVHDLREDFLLARD